MAASWHHSWSGMKGANKPRRTWMTWGEFEESLAIFGIRLSWHQVRRILADDPPPKSQNGFRYEVRHLEKVRKYLQGKEDHGLAAG